MQWLLIITVTANTQTLAVTSQMVSERQCKAAYQYCQNNRLMTATCISPDGVMLQPN